MKDIYITWDDYHNKIELLAKKVYEDNLKFNQIIEKDWKFRFWKWRLWYSKKLEKGSSKRIGIPIKSNLFRIQNRLILVAGSGIEPLTSGLWVPRSNQLSYPAINWIFLYKLKNYLASFMKISPIPDFNWSNGVLFRNSQNLPVTWCELM